MNNPSKELRKKIIELFRRFSMDPHHSPLKKQKDREIAGRFIDRLHSTTFDGTRLPYYSTNGLAKHSNKAECVFALMCGVVLSYWRVLGKSTESSLEQLDGDIKRLEHVYHSFATLKVLGDSKGYCLFKSQREDLYGSKKEKQPESEEVSQEETDEGIDGTAPREETQVRDNRVKDDSEPSTENTE